MQNILVVDDDPEIVRLISIYLQNEGYQVTSARNGREAKGIVELHHESIEAASSEKETVFRVTLPLR